MPDLATQIHEGIHGSYDWFNARLEAVPYSWSEADLTVSGNFFFVTFRDGVPTVDEFVEQVYGQIIHYCIPRKVREDYRRRFVETNNFALMQALSDEARHLFITARNSQRTSGEIGELILFIMLEAVLGAPQLVCKMTLKTSQHMPVHGSDAIHIAVGSAPNSVRLWWGESKLYQSLPQALDEVCQSIIEFLSLSQVRGARSRDLDIIRDHLSLTPDPVLSAAILEYFDPYSPAYNQREEAFACLVGFNYGTYDQLSACPREEVRDFFRREYEKRIKSACKLFGEKLRANNLASQRVHFFLLPFPEVEDIRSRFFARLGVAA